MGGEFYKLGLGKGSAEIVVGQVNRPEESVARHDRVKEKIYTGERSDVTWAAGGQEDSRRSPPVVPRTRRSTPEVRERRGPGRRREEGDHFSLGTGLK